MCKQTYKNVILINGELVIGPENEIVKPISNFCRGTGVHFSLMPLVANGLLGQPPVKKMGKSRSKGKVH